MGRPQSIGPWLVALGAGLWGTETAWRIPLGRVFAPDVLVLWEQAFLVVCALPLVLPRLAELRAASARAIAWIVVSGVAGAALGTMLFTVALARGNPTVANLVLTLQPVLSAAVAWLFYRDPIARGFAPWAALAVIAAAVLIGWPFDAGAGYALLCALAWALATVAGRGVMLELSPGLASGLRAMVGLGAMLAIAGARGHIGPALWPAAASAAPLAVIGQLAALAMLSGTAALAIYFRGLALSAPAATARAELAQPVVAVAIAWARFGGALTWVQSIAAVALIAAIALAQRAQTR